MVGQNGTNVAIELEFFGGTDGDGRQKGRQKNNSARWKTRSHSARYLLRGRSVRGRRVAWIFAGRGIFTHERVEIFFEIGKAVAIGISVGVAGVVGIQTSALFPIIGNPVVI